MQFRSSAGRLKKPVLLVRRDVVAIVTDDVSLDAVPLTMTLSVVPEGDMCILVRRPKMRMEWSQLVVMILMFGVK